MLIQSIFVIQILIVLMLYILGNRKPDYKELAENYGEGFQLNFLAPASLFLIDKFNIYERAKPIVQKIHDRIIRIYGIPNAASYTRMFLAQAISSMLLVPVLMSFLTIMADVGIGGVLFGLLLGGVVPAGLYNDLDKKIKQREQAIILELPELLNKIILLVNAGENLQDALMRSVQNKVQEIEHSTTSHLNPLYEELKPMLNDLRNNRSFGDTMQDFSKRCSVHEVSVFVTTVLLNYSRGGGEFVNALQELAQNLWVKRMAVARILGEEASSKLVFPLALIFIAILVIIAAPAVMIM